MTGSVLLSLQHDVDDMGHYNTTGRSGRTNDVCRIVNVRYYYQNGIPVLINIIYNHYKYKIIKYYVAVHYMFITKLKRSGFHSLAIP